MLILNSVENFQSQNAHYSRYYCTTEPYQTNLKCYFNLQVRFKQTKNIENLKTDLTTRLQPSIGPFRHIYTPAGGTEVTSLDQIQKDKEYVAGMERFCNF